MDSTSPVDPNAAPLEPGPEAHARGAAGLRRDPLFWFLAITVVSLSVPFALPWLDPVKVFEWGELWGMPIMLIACLVALVPGVRGITDSGERRFWNGLILAVGFNLLVRLLHLMAMAGHPQSSLLVDISYLLFYFFLIRALRWRPDPPSGAVPDPTPRVETLATAILLAGLLVYFVLIPESMTPEGYASWVPSMVLYTTLDLYLLVSLIHLHQASTSERWRVIYAWLAICTLGWTATDIYEAGYYLQWFDFIDESSPLNALWYLPYAFLGMTGRVRASPWPRSFAAVGYHPDPTGPRSRTVGIVVLYALALPMIHFLVNLTGVMDPVSRDAREVTVFVVLPILMWIAFVHQRMLERRAQSLEAAGRVLEEQRALLQTAVQQTPESVLLVDADGILVYANPAWERLSGRALDQVVGRSVLEPLGDLGEAAVDLFRSAHEVGPGSTRLTRNDPSGGEIVEDLFISPVRTTDGELTHYSISLRDVTKESQLERRVSQGQRMEALGTLAGGIAHDFNNILAAILGYSELVLDNEDLQQDVREDMSAVVTAAERAKALTAQILTFSRQKDAAKRQVHLGSAVLEALKLVRPTMPTSVSLAVDVDPDCGPILAEEGKLHQVVLNLLSNAVEAVEGRGALWVSVQERDEDWSRTTGLQSAELPPGHYAVLSVRDDGVGMDQNALDRVYDPFYTTRKLGHGTGLGLSVVHGIVRGHDGGIVIDSAPGQGTRFDVYFPVVTAPGSESRSTTGTSRSSDPASVHILVVDDEVMVANVLSRVLERTGYRVTTANDPREALGLFTSDPSTFQMLITDQTMPGLSGLALAAEVRRIKAVPVLLLTGYSESVTPERMNESGVAEVLYKPVGRADLTLAVERQLMARAGTA